MCGRSQVREVIREREREERERGERERREGGEGDEIERETEKKGV